MSVMIRDYSNPSGEHCGSSAMRNLVRHYCDLDLAEETLFGLGSGLDFVYIESEELTPSALIFGRGLTMEADAAASLGIDYRETMEPNDDRAWAQVRDEVAAGRPTMLSGDTFYLDYHSSYRRVHFPSHRYVLLGFEDETRSAFVADRMVAQPQTCHYDSLRKSRNPPDFISTYNLWGKFHDTRVTRSMPEAFSIALQRSTRRMLGQDKSLAKLAGMLAGGKHFDVTGGLPGMTRLRERLSSWLERADAATVANYASACIEKYGTGGGNFRTMYACFLGEARRVVPELVGDELPCLMADSSARWTELSRQLAVIGERRGNGCQEQLAHSLDALAAIIELETRVFQSIADAGQLPRVTPGVP